MRWTSAVFPSWPLASARLPRARREPREPWRFAVVGGGRSRVGCCVTPPPGLICWPPVGPRYAVRHVIDERQAHAGERRASEAVYGVIWEEAAARLNATVAQRPGGFLEIRRNGAAHPCVAAVGASGRRRHHPCRPRSHLRARARSPTPASRSPSTSHAVSIGSSLRRRSWPGTARWWSSRRQAPAAVAARPRACARGRSCVRAALLASRHDRELVVERRAEGARVPVPVPRR